MRYRWGVCAALVLACFGFACSTKEQQWDLEDVLQKVLPQPSSLTKACNGKRLFQAPLHVGEILDYVAKWDAQNPVRKTRAFDCFSGFGNVGSVYRAAGHRCPGFDYEFNGLQDLTCREGFFAALEMFLDIVEYGLVVAGPPCSLWIWLSCSHHCRHNQCVMGDIGEIDVRQHNALVLNFITLLCIGTVRKVWSLVEQPCRSYMFKLKQFLLWAKLTGAKTIHTWMISFGHDMAKPTVLLSDLPTAGYLKRVWSKKKQREQIRTSKKMAAKSCFTISFKKFYKLQRSLQHILGQKHVLRNRQKPSKEYIKNREVGVWRN